MYGSTDDHPHGEDVIYYLTVYNEPISQPGRARGRRRRGHPQGHLPRRRTADGLAEDAPRVQLLASGVGLPVDRRRPQQLLAEDWGVSADTWSVTSWNELARDAVAAEEWNLLHPVRGAAHGRTSPTSSPAPPGPVVAVSDYMRAVPQQIARWVPGDYHVLGADGFGFADTRPAARRFFHIDAAVGRRARRSQALADAGRGRPRRRRRRRSTQYRIDDPTAVAGVKQEGGDA